MQEVRRKLRVRLSDPPRTTYNIKPMKLDEKYIYGHCVCSLLPIKYTPQVSTYPDYS